MTKLSGSERSCVNAVHDSRLEIHECSGRPIPSSRCFIVIHIDAFQLGLNRRDTNHIQDRINEINALGVVTFRTVVDGANLAENKVVGLEPIAPGT